jgi:hypothetical protein
MDRPPDPTECFMCVYGMFAFSAFRRVANFKKSRLIYKIYSRTTRNTRGRKRLRWSW